MDGSPNPEFGEEADVGPKEEGGYGNGKKINFRVQTTLLHDGEVNCARSMPQDHFVIATKTPTAGQCCVELLWRCKDFISCLLSFVFCSFFFLLSSFFLFSCTYFLAHILARRARV